MPGSALIAAGYSFMAPAHDAGFAYLLLGETLGPQGLAGAGTAIHQAGLSGDLDMIKFLTERGADLKCTTRDGKTREPINPSEFLWSPIPFGNSYGPLSIPSWNL